MIHQRKILKAIAYAILLCFTSLTGAQPLYAIPANTQLPTGPDGTVGKPHDVLENVITGQNGNTLTITQDGKTSVLEWGNFSIGADAAVEFKSTVDGFNSLNYVTGANAPISEIYGQLTALGGNIFIANPAGVQIGNSAQINVGSLYVTNKDVGEAVKHLGKTSEESDIISAINTHGVAETNAELMSLGAIVNAKKVTFDGGRIVLDTDRIYADNTEGELQPVDDAALTGMLNIITTDKDNVVLGSSERANIFENFSITENGKVEQLEKGYTWIHDLAELQAMDKNKSGWYALRNSIDANATAGTGFDSIGTDADRFTGRFDGLGYSIFGLNIDKDATENIGLFGYAQNATIRNFTLNSSEIKGGANTGAVVGHADGGKIENVTNTGNVTGGDGTGGIVGKAENNVAMSGLINIGKVTGGVGTGGVVGSMSGGTLGGDTYNLGSVTGTSSVGGIAGSVTDATIGNEVTQANPDAFQIFNQLNVTGDHNVGGIAGTLSGGTITNAANHGNITATGFIDDNYKYHTAVTNFQNLDGATLSDGVATIAVKAANAGGIAGKTENSAKISNVVNEGDVTTKTEGDDNYYIAGNVGGIVGRAEDTTITNAENKENKVAGAHNVGGVAGFLGGVSSVEVGVNNGGDITATGARKAYDSDYAKERVRPFANDANELFNIGNVGGVVGYLFGDKANIRNSGNRGTVHSAEIKDQQTVPETAKAANVGGVVGKIDTQSAAKIDDVKKQENNAYVNANVANSYNTGDVQGYTGVGGVAGMMYNGSIAGSYNLGTLKTTRQVDNSGGSNIAPLNMGGVVGDTTEETDASAVLYDVYNAGQIGDDTYTYYARHVGGVAGRLSGHIEKAYNTGDIYNYDTTVGGIAGWWYNGTISNVFNTGNITVRTNTEMQVGGIVGSSSPLAQSLSYAYNLGTIRGFQEGHKDHWTWADIFVGGIIGRARGGGVSIDNVYTLGNLYAATGTYNATTGGIYTKVGADSGLGAIYGGTDKPTLSNANYITPENPDNATQPKFEDLSEQAERQGIHVVEYNNKSNADAYELNIEKLYTASDWSVDTAVNKWRLYDEGTPILNVFMPSMEATDAWKGQLVQGDRVQYGTAYNPLLTILNLKNPDNVTFNWGGLGLYGAGGLAVYGGGLTIDGFQSAGDGRYFGGTIFSEGKLNITGTGTNFNLGSASKLYGSSVKLNANGGDISAYGEVTSTNGNIEFSGKNVEIIGSLTAKAKDKTTSVDGVSGASTTSKMDTTNLNDPNKAMKSVSDMFTYTTGEAETNGNITVNASGAAEVLYGNLGTGSVSTAGNFTVNGGVQEDGTLSGGSVYVDSDLSGTTGNINLSAGGEVLLDITNIAKANSNGEGDNGKDALHTFLGNYDKSKGNHKEITLSSENDDEIIAIDMWNDGTDTGSFALDKYNLANGKTLKDAFGKLNLGNGLSAEDIVHIWVSDAEQLKGIQSYYDSVTTTGETTKILSYNFALKGNIDASALTGYEEIGGGGTTDGYSGTFDGRGFRIIGLNADATKADEASSGIFGKLAGTVKDLRVYASKFFGGDGESAGTIASEVITQTKEDGSTVSGTITGVTTFGNTVTVENGAAGGIAGKNSGSILESTASDSVTASGENAYAGGVAGVNTGSIGEEGEAGESAQITADSAVRSDADGAAAIGGVVGKNENGGKVWLANSLGVTTGANAKSTGGIAGTNSGTMHSLYNESIVTGQNNVGGVAGTNGGSITNAVNTTDITATGELAGGIAGVNSGGIDSGRNTGIVNGTNSVGGMVGANEKGGILENLSNAVTAAIFGGTNVGGIAGTNSGTITSDNNLVNEGTVHGNQFVGGIAGVNEQGGVIQNVTSETLVLKTADGTNAQYFGGIAGQNKGIITDATNESNVEAKDATYVGGIAGHNEGDLKGELTNNGDIIGLQYVGGLAGKNDNDFVLIGTPDNRLQVTNNGRISAENGSAGGIFYENNGEIKYADIVNTGVVDGRGQQNTGGLFGTNSGAITNSTLTNSGEVIGSGNTGGLIGKNTGDVSFSSLINEYGATVTGGENTGGLFGYNTGKITGGRNDAGTKYEHKIYNNGTVTGDSNVGGLIGNNAGGSVLTAGYNTGAVNVTEGGSGENVGGIAGTNAGIIDQVFNTVMTGIDELGETLFGAVTGTNNVGGIVGNNTGKLTNAYNTTTVKSDETKGNIAGANSGTVANVYATNETGMLIGTGNATDSYSFSDADNDKEGISVIAQADRNKQDSYGKFNFTDTDGDKAVWKIYEGKNGQDADGTPLLKVFLTKAEYTGGTGFTYNGQGQGLSLDGVTVDGEKLSDVAKTLLSALTGKNAYDGYLGFTSEQIAASNGEEGFNPNNLGYDIDATFYISKAQLSVTLDEISREYGNGQIKNDNATTADGHYYNNGYGYTVTADNLTQEMIDELGGEGFYTFVRDGAVDGVSGQKKTNDVDSYTWSAAFKLGELAQNYEFADSGDDTLTVDNGVSKVTPATLTIQLDNVNRTYGDISKPQYSIKDDGNLVNGDAGKLFFNAEAYEAVPGDNETYGDGALYTVNGDTRTKDVGGTYYWNVAEQDYAKVFGGINTNNYNITVIKGESNVTPKELSISSVLATIMYGNQNNEGFKVNVGNLVGFAEGYGDEEQVKLDSAYFNNTSKGTFSTEYINSQSNRVTADAGTYENGITYSGLSTLGLLTGGKAKNYVLADSVTGNVEVKQANLTVSLGDVFRVYGDLNADYNIADVTGLVNEDEDGTVTFNKDMITDGGLVDNKTKTNNANRENEHYTWSLDKEALGGVANLLNNYSVTINNGKSTVTKANLKVDLDAVTRVYGDLDADYNIADVTGLVNGDEDYSLTFNKDMVADGALIDGKTKTNDVGSYSWSFAKEALEGVKNLLLNYIVTVGTADSTVIKANLTVTADDQNMLVGTTPNFTGTTLGELEHQLVNGDRLPSGFGYEFGIEDESVLNIVGAHPGVIGLFYDGTFYGGGTHNLSTLSSVFRNYDVTVDAGTLTVSAGDNFGHLHWLHRGGERVRNFRERKAGLHFVDGGMIYEEDM